MPHSGTRSAMEISTTSMARTLIRTIRAVRSGASVSSSRTSSHTPWNGAATGWPSCCAVALIARSSPSVADDHHRRGADPHQLRRWVLQGDPDGEALGDPDPVEIAPDRWNSGDGEVVQPGDRR